MLVISTNLNHSIAPTSQAQQLLTTSLPYLNTVSVFASYTTLNYFLHSQPETILNTK
jgi:hypothetical protein